MTTQTRIHAVLRAAERRKLARTLAASETPSDRRWAGRRETDLIGMLVFEDNMGTVSCRIADMSSSGARLLLDPPSMQKLERVRIGGTIRLVMTQSRVRTDVLCLIVRLGEDELGVRFTSPFATLEIARSRFAK